MSFAKELLFSCVVMMHVSFVVMQPLNKESLCKDLKDIGFPLENLRLAEQNYVKLMFHGNRLTKYNLSEGITFGTTTEEIQASACAIIDYLGNHLPNCSFGNLTGQFNPIMGNVTWFLHHFKAAVKLNDTMTQCTKREIKTTEHLYDRKKMGLHILYSSRRWVEHFTNTRVCSRAD